MRILATAGFFLGSSAALACATYSATQIAEAIRNSPYASQRMKASACDFGGAAISESGGRSCNHNRANFGVLQLNVGNLGGVPPQSYLSWGLQDQVNLWVKQVGNSNTTGGYAVLASASSINGIRVTPGMLAACFQFGPVICRNNISYMRQNGTCPTATRGGIRATRATLRNGTANLDGGKQSICSWGKNIQNNINKNSALCRGSKVTNLPQTPSGSCEDTGMPNTHTVQGTAKNVPKPTATDTEVYNI